MLAKDHFLLGILSLRAVKARDGHEPHLWGVLQFVAGPQTYTNQEVGLQTDVVCVGL